MTRVEAMLRIGSVFVAGCLITLAGMALPTAAIGAEQEVDLALVLAVDISYSMDEDEQKLQRQGYVDALRSPEVLEAISKGAIGRIAVTYVEWAGQRSQDVIVPWTIIEGPESADAFTEKLAAAPIRRAFRTSISGGIDFSAALFPKSGVKATRRVIDVSGDGPNNEGRAVTDARDEAIAQGITINGLPILLKRPGYADINDLDVYYRNCVIGGVGAFMVQVREVNQFPDVIRSKIMTEVSDLGGAPRQRFGWTDMPGEADPLITPADMTGFSLPLQLAQAQPRPDPLQKMPQRTTCMVGERMWNQRMGN
jgi:hypothetical protein